MRHHASLFSLGAFIALVGSMGCGADPPNSSSQTVQSSASTNGVGTPKAETFQAIETWDPFGLFGRGPIGDIAAMGTLFCPGAPGANPILGPGDVPMCPPGSKTFVRGFVLRSPVVAVDPQDEAFLSGWVMVDLNQSFDELGLGTSNTKWTWYVGGRDLQVGDTQDALGVWEGSSQGVATVGTQEECAQSPLYDSLPSNIDPDVCHVSRYQLVGKGSAGNVVGMQIRANLTAYTYGSPYAFVATLDMQLFTP